MLRHRNFRLPWIVCRGPALWRRACDRCFLREGEVADTAARRRWERAPLRSFRIDELAAIGGLDREQVEHLVGDPGFPVYGSGGADRFYVAPDLFNVGLAGALHRLGLGLPAIRAVVAGLGPCEIDAQGRPIEMFPGQRREKFTPCLIVVRPVGSAFATSLVSPSELWAAIAAYDAGASLVVDATALAERIARAVDEPNAPLLLPERGPLRAPLRDGRPERL